MDTAPSPCGVRAARSSPSRSPRAPRERSTLRSATVSTARSSCDPAGSGWTGTALAGSCAASPAAPRSTTHRAAHPAPRVHHRSPRRWRPGARRPGSRLPRRPPDDHGLRPRPGLPRPARHLRCRRVPRRSRPIAPAIEHGCPRPGRRGQRAAIKPSFSAQRVKLGLAHMDRSRAAGDSLSSLNEWMPYVSPPACQSGASPNAEPAHTLRA